MLRETLAHWLMCTQGCAVVGVTDVGSETLRLCALSQPNIVVLEIEPTCPDTMFTVARLRRNGPDGGPFVVGLHDTADTAKLRPYRPQVHRLVSLRAGLPALQAAIRDWAQAGGVGTVGLTGREVEVLTLICAGCSASQAGRVLGISMHTVANHKRRIFSKLGVQSRAQAMAEGTRLGLVGRDTVAAFAPSPRPRALTGRERDILVSIAHGHSVRQTAQALGIAIKTVQSEQRQLFSRLGVTNRAEALTLARELNLIEEPTPDQ